MASTVILLSRGPGDSVGRIVATMRRPALYLSGRTSLKQLAALYQRARVVISTYTGPMHLEKIRAKGATEDGRN